MTSLLALAVDDVVQVVPVADLVKFIPLLFGGKASTAIVTGDLVAALTGCLVRLPVIMQRLRTAIVMFVLTLNVLAT